jgi:hypothetical protein
MAEKLSKEIVDAATAGTIWDGGHKAAVRGFGVRVHAGGTKTFSSTIGSMAGSAATRSGSIRFGR